MQEVIVYRNPVEAAVWHGLASTDGNTWIIIILSLIIPLIVFVCGAQFLQRKFGYRKSGYYITWLGWICALWAVGMLVGRPYII